MASQYYKKVVLSVETVNVKHQKDSSHELTSVGSRLVDADVLASAVVLLALVDVDASRDVIELVSGGADARRHAVDDVALVVAAVVRRAVHRERLLRRRRRKRRLVMRRFRRRRRVRVDVAVRLNPGPALLLAEEVAEAGSGKLVA